MLRLQEMPFELLTPDIGMGSVRGVASSIPVYSINFRRVLLRNLSLPKPKPDVGTKILCLAIWKKGGASFLSRQQN